VAGLGLGFGFGGAGGIGGAGEIGGGGTRDCGAAADGDGTGEETAADGVGETAGVGVGPPAVSMVVVRSQAAAPRTSASTGTILLERFTRAMVSATSADGQLG
jgi:hypothetical protein